MKLTEKTSAENGTEKRTLWRWHHHAGRGLPSDPGWTLKKLSCPFFHIQKNEIWKNDPR